MRLTKSEIVDLFDFSRAADAVRQAYIATADRAVQAPDVTYLGFPEVRGDCHIKAAHMHGAELFVIKIATGFYDNPAKGLPSSNGMNLLFSAQTGELVASLQDEGWLTDMRTGLGGVIATLALAREGFGRVLIVGTGIQARLQARCLHMLRPEQAIEFHIWGRRPAAAAQAAQDLAQLGLSAQMTDDLPRACAETDVIITTTPSETPLILSDWVRDGTHVTAIGADCPGKQELATDLVARARLRVADLAAQSLDHGEFQSARAAGILGADDVVTLGAVLSGAHPGRADPADITIADLTGLAAQDAAISLSILDAINQG